MRERKSIWKAIVKLLFICVRKHDDNNTETYHEEEGVVNEILEELN
jgi:hypothetical protein